MPKGTVRNGRVIIREQDPLKQGLKLMLILFHLFFVYIREQDPLKQGLKLAYGLILNRAYSIREQDPLKQGLKLKNEYIKNVLSVNSRARSIKTRIETK